MTKKAVFKYIALSLTFAFLSSGVLVAGFLDVYDLMGPRIFWLLLPMTLLLISAVVVNDRLLIPRLLLNGRYVVYCFGVFIVVNLASIVFLCLEYMTRCFLEVPMRIADYSSPWILADTFFNSLLLAMILWGLSVFHLYKQWRYDAEEEKRLTHRLEEYIATVNKRLKLSIILDKLPSIPEDPVNTPEATVTKIRELSDYLRNQLYELPDPPSVDTMEPTDARHSLIADWLVSGPYRPLRHIIFIAILAAISCGAFFNAPDQPEFTSDRLLGVLSMFGFLLFIAYINILWLYPKFLKRGNVGRYVISVTLLLLAITAPLIILQVLTFEPNVYSKPLPPFIAVISTAASIVTLFLFIGGISSAVLLQNWEQTNHRMILLKAETIRQEYAWLRKQINPHFLFNVLNNIVVCAYDDPQLTGQLLSELQHLLKYQLSDISREITTVKEESAFLTSFLALESTRRDRFEYSLENDSLDDVRIPTLIFIPFVENAVKYSSTEIDVPVVRVRFSIEQNMLRFICRNSFHPDRVMTMMRGGIGVGNTLRRLKYIYSDKFVYSVTKDLKSYTVDLKIPLTWNVL